ncbi:nicotinate phosphoribosyltransferase [Priestia megaterium]|nr:nicotinate phosphoribosyltransferase [Priestia megaterium]
MTTNNQDIINFKEIRVQKQLQSDHAIQRFYDEYLFFVNRYTNIREKVRASHLFRERMGVSHDAELSAQMEDLFLQWFAFDYVTIQGQTLFQQFLREQVSKQHASFLIQGALFLTSVLEPIVVSKVPNSFFLKGQIPLTNKQAIIKDVRGRFIDIQLGQAVWCRKIKSIGYDVLIGSFFVQDAKIIEQLHHSFDKKSKMTWRAFLKNYAIDYCLR